MNADGTGARRPGQPGKNEGDDAGLVGRDRWKSPSSPPIPPEEPERSWPEGTTLEDVQAEMGQVSPGRTDLPPIPDRECSGCFGSGLAYAENGTEACPDCSGVGRAVDPRDLRLAAAVLRWAAEQMPDPLAFIERHRMSTTPGVGPVLAATYADLRRLADEVAP